MEDSQEGRGLRLAGAPEETAAAANCAGSVQAGGRRDAADGPRRAAQTAAYDHTDHRLIEEHGADVSYQMVRRYVSDRKPEILAAAGKAPVEAFVPQTHLPGHKAEVGFGDVTVRLAGGRVTCYLFSLRLPYSGKAVHRIFASCGQEAFSEGHVLAHRTLGGAPRSKIRYDNLKSTVAKVVGLNRARVESDRWIAFRSHFNIESFYCRPGIEGAHEKGGVEGMIGYFRRNHFTPVPQVDSLAELNEMVDQWNLHDGHRRIGSRPRTVDEYFAVEQRLLMPLRKSRSRPAACSRHGPTATARSPPAPTATRSRPV